MTSTFTPARLESFSDGVIAVIITITVLELKVPHESGWVGLRQIIPTLSIYLVSFLFTGVYWVNHHELVSRLHRTNNRILWANLIWLFTLSLIPFFTSFLVDHNMDSFSVAVYSASMFFTGMTFLLLRYAVDRQLEKEGRETGLTTALRRKHWGSVALYAFSFGMAGYYPRLALYSTALVALVWIVPTLAVDSGVAFPATETPGTR